MAHEPCGLVADVHHPVELMGADAFLAAGHQVEGLQPLVQGDLAALHDGAHRDREILPALLRSTTIHARLFGLVSLSDRAAMRANRLPTPTEPFEVLSGLLVVSSI